ncbi:TIGR03118 family protein [Acidicapsa ligni]|uniref:TIGR03118 family protein n=1 Tax=Acidicapsa ligni TaxID=542300 RepID=UPI0021E0556A|nr:TIGR03118 family protein [Acidicapsa ligni]
MKDLSYLAAATLLALATVPAAFAQHYTQVNLVANTSGIAPITDPNLVNPWGLSRTSSSDWWVSDNGTGLSTLYNGVGTINSLVVTIPKAAPNSKTFPTGTPTGTISNASTTDFLLAPGKPADFLFATIDGTISAWNPTVGIPAGGVAPSKLATVVFKATDGSSYTGLTSAKIDGKTYLYAANFTKGRVDVFDNAFAKVPLSKISGHDNDRNHDRFDENEFASNSNESLFSDDRLPRDFVPFNVQAIGNNIVVTFVLHQEGNPFETDGEGLGYVDIFSSTGKLLQRLEHGRWLNAPWGIALAPLDFGAFSHDLLIGQFAGGNPAEFGGTIAVYNPVTGDFIGDIKDASGKTLSIPGLWAISPANSASTSSYDTSAAPASELYFTAGPDNGTGGLFGYLKPVAAELTQGNNQ